MIAAIPAGWEEVVAGIFTGGCVERGEGSSFRRMAHFHHVGEYTGWICLRSAKRLTTASGKPTAVMYHEYAHALVAAAGYSSETHGVHWCRIIADLGFPAEAKWAAPAAAKRAGVR